ncbi:MAG: hypothetical protein K2P79_14510 [Sphingomonas sp.]|nr:hypothetical protein [Sphingomonas sp.]
MTGFRILLAAILVLITGYTLPVIAQHGLGLVPLFFAAISEMSWQGQFNVDFSCFLILSGLWVAWRNNFSLLGLALAPVASFGGAMFLSIYLLITSFQVHGDMAALLLGTRRAAALRN